MVLLFEERAEFLESADAFHHLFEAAGDGFAGGDGFIELLEFHGGEVGDVSGIGAIIGCGLFVEFCLKGVGLGGVEDAFESIDEGVVAEGLAAAEVVAVEGVHDAFEVGSGFGLEFLVFVLGDFAAFEGVAGEHELHECGGVFLEFGDGGFGAFDFAGLEFLVEFGGSGFLFLVELEFVVESAEAGADSHAAAAEATELACGCHFGHGDGVFEEADDVAGDEFGEVGAGFAIFADELGVFGRVARACAVGGVVFRVGIGTEGGRSIGAGWGSGGF